jgi:hypothetical protein
MRSIAAVKLQQHLQIKAQADAAARR